MHAPTSGHDIVVVGASAGGVEVLREVAREVARGLDADLPAALFVVLHVRATAVSMLPEILTRAGSLPAAHVRDGEPIEPGRVYVAPLNHHLLIRDGLVRLSVGPRENRSRPAIDPLFRSAARAFGRRVVGVVLSGSLDDGASGLLAIKTRGGLAVVQDPDDALFDSMPRAACAAVPPDEVLPAAHIGAAINRLVRTPLTGEERPVDRNLDLETRIAEVDLETLHGEEHPGTPASLACPECGGTLWELREGELLRYRCRVGHAFTAAFLHEEQADQLEEALWAALRTLEEQASLARRMAAHAGERHLPVSVARYEEQEREALHRAALVRGVLLRAAVPDEEPVVG
jgi:two-component system chemotaxis response regulator CheB